MGTPFSSSHPKKTIYKENIDQGYYRFLYLRDESSIAAARRTAQLFSAVLGTKRCAFVIDACFAEMFESYSRSSSSSSSSSCGAGEHSGQCVFATELLGGILIKNSNEQLSKSTLHLLSSLASSVFPVIVSNPFWSLPTVLDLNHEDRGGVDRKLGSEHSGKALTTLRQVQYYDHEACTDQSVTIMNSNAIVILALMGFIRQFTQALGDSMRLHLPTVLFPILERASPIGNHPSVQRSTITSLQEITIALGRDDISSLIASNFDYMVDVISLRLRTYARDQTPMERSLVGVVDVILRSAVYHGGSSSVRMNQSSSGDVMPDCTGHVTIVGHMLHCLLNHLHRQSHITNLSIFDLARVFQSMNNFMDSSIVNHISKLSVAAPDTLDDKDDWFQRLDFELNVESSGCMEDNEFDNDFCKEHEDSLNAVICCATQTYKSKCYAAKQYYLVFNHLAKSVLSEGKCTANQQATLYFQQ